MIIFNAFACDPEMGSERGLGWNWVTYVARRYRTHLITAHTDRKSILLNAISEDPELKRNLSVSFIPWAIPRDPVSLLLTEYYQPYYHFFYRRWMRHSYELAKNMCLEYDVLLVHHNTYHSYREPGDFWRLPVPTVWAPVAGVSNIPWGLLPALGVLEGSRQAARNIINSGHKVLNRRFRRAVGAYSRVIAGSDEAASFFRRFRSDIEIIPGQLVGPMAIADAQDIRSEGTLELVFCGQHFGRKGGSFLIKGLAMAMRSVPLHLHLIGQGPMSASWRRLASDLGVEKMITWHGRVDRARVYEILKQADVFVFPSINDCYPTVIAEAFAAGLPVITTDIPGVGDMVDKSSGILLSARSPSLLVHALANALVRLSTNRDELARLRRGVRQRAEAFSFDVQMQRLADIYSELLE